jgi:putative tryptophan/tyrosine transport system substrate-binding protein
MRRIGLAVVLAVSMFLVPLAAGAQAGKMPRIGWLMGGSPSSHSVFLDAFRQGLRDVGYTEGKNIAIEPRYTHGAHDRLPDLTAELLRLKVDVIVVDGTAPASAAKAATAQVPIVFTLAGDPVGSGLVASFAHPGGNVTGLSNLRGDLSGKQLQLLKELVPQLARVAVLYNPLNPAYRTYLDGARVAGRALAVELQVLEVRNSNELTSAFSALARGRAGALLALGDVIFRTEQVQLLRLAEESRLPAMYSDKLFVEAGGLMSYGVSYPDNFRRAATYVDKILKGAKPADLPVEQPTKFELVINLKTAKALNLTIPQSVLLRADQVIE